VGDDALINCISLKDGPAALRLRQLSELALWLEESLKKPTLDKQAICVRQLELSSILVGSGKRDLMVRFLCALGKAPPGDEEVSTVLQIQRTNVQGTLTAPREPQHLHYLLMQAGDDEQAIQVWEQLAIHDAYLTPDILVQIILNCGHRNVIMQAWEKAADMLELERRHLQTLAIKAPLVEIRDLAQRLIGR
jgi:hypothetical protein